MATSCVGKNRCSSHAPGWLSTPHPSKDDGIVSGTVCFHWASSCCHWSTNIRVRNCSGFYVYELGPVPNCWLRYCGNGGGMWHLASLTLFDTIIQSQYTVHFPRAPLIPTHPPPPPIPHLQTYPVNKNIHPGASPPPACVDMNSTFYDVLKLKKAIKFKKRILISTAMQLALQYLF